MHEDLPNMQDDLERRMYTLPEAARELGVEYRTLAAWLKAAKIDPVRSKTDARMHLLTLQQISTLASMHKRPWRDQGTLNTRLTTQGLTNRPTREFKTVLITILILIVIGLIVAANSILGNVIATHVNLPVGIAITLLILAVVVAAVVTALSRLQ
jgi:hypothetical protein